MAKARAAVALYRYNVEETGIDDRVPIGAVLREVSGEIVGGLWGRTELGLLFLDMFFVPGHLRGRCYGASLLELVETEACRRGCVGAVVETSSFQAHVAMPSMPPKIMLSGMRVHPWRCVKPTNGQRELSSSTGQSSWPRIGSSS
jgi:GNAT superfamily N-acetyltransferase